MLANPENKNISIHNYDQEIFMKFMLALWLFIIRSLTLVHLKVIDNIECWICISTTMLYYEINNKKSFLTTMLEYLVIHNSSVTDIYIEDISDMKFQLHQFHLDQYFIQQKQENDCRHLFTSTSFELIFWKIKSSQHSMLYNHDTNNIYIHNYFQ